MTTSPATIERFAADIVSEFAAGTGELAPAAIAFRDDEVLLWVTAVGAGDRSQTARLLGLAAPVAAADCLVHVAEATARLDDHDTDALVVTTVDAAGNRAVRLWPYTIEQRRRSTRRKVGDEVTFDAGDAVFGALLDDLSSSFHLANDPSARIAASQRLLSAGFELQLSERLDDELNALLGQR